MKKQILPINFYIDKLFDTEENIDREIVIDSILALTEVENSFQLNRLYSYIEDMYNQKKFFADDCELLIVHLESLQNE